MIECVNSVYQLTVDSFPLNAELVRKYTEEDETLKLVCNYFQCGWLETIPKSQGNIVPYFNRKLSLSLHSGIVLSQTQLLRVVVPETLQEEIVSMLHDDHCRKMRMKKIARRYVWFPNIDKAVENKHNTCTICLDSSNYPKTEISS